MIQTAKQDRAGPLTFSPTPSLDQSEFLEATTQADDDQAELMRWHYRLGHLPFVQLKQLAKKGEIPRKLAKTTPPRCAGCLFDAMTKVPWQTKGSESGKQVFRATRPGQVVSVDQMESTQPGFVGQLKGRLTKQRYKAATVFVDHFSGLRYIHTMTSTSSNETIKAKLAFEQFMSSTITQTTAASPTTPSSTTVPNGNNDTHLLRGQCPLPKRSGRESHQGHH